MRKLTHAWREHHTKRPQLADRFKPKIFFPALLYHTFIIIIILLIIIVFVIVVVVPSHLSLAQNSHTRKTVKILPQ